MRVRKMMQVSWPFVALSAIGGGFFLGLFALIPNDQPEGRTALLGLVSLAGTAVVTALTHRMNNKLRDVQEKVNGRMSELIAKTQPADVSRETSPAVARVAKKVAAAPKVQAAKKTVAKAAVQAKKRTR